MKIIKNILPLLAIAASALGATAAKAPLFEVTRVNIQRVHDNALSVTFSLDTRDIRPGNDREVVFTPVIRAIGSTDSLELPTVKIAGRNRYYAYERDGEPVTYHAWHTDEAMAGIIIPKDDDTDTGNRAPSRAENTENYVKCSATVAEISVGRLMTHRNPVLNINRTSDSRTVVSVPIIDYCIMSKSYQKVPLESQDYLDRQDLYPMTFFLDERDEWIRSLICIGSWKYDVKNAGGNHDDALKNVTIDQGDNREDGEKGVNGLGDELKANSFEWDTTHTELNNQMFGIFTLNTTNRNATDTSPLRINAKSVLIHSWVRRLTSKVTVAFDGTELYDNVQVFIETITIHDIPKSCTLGNENHPGGNGMASKDRYNVLHKAGKTITIQDIPKDGIIE